MNEFTVQKNSKWTKFFSFAAPNYDYFEVLETILNIWIKFMNTTKLKFYWNRRIVKWHWQKPNRIFNCYSGIVAESWTNWNDDRLFLVCENNKRKKKNTVESYCREQKSKAWTLISQKKTKKWKNESKCNEKKLHWRAQLIVDCMHWAQFLIKHIN